jgi:hypothetical protein
VQLLEQVIRGFNRVVATIAEHDRIGAELAAANTLLGKSKLLEDKDQTEEQEARISLLEMEAKAINDYSSNEFGRLVPELREIAVMMRVTLEKYDELLGNYYSLEKAFELLDHADLFDSDLSSGESREDYKDGMEHLGKALDACLSSFKITMPALFD